MEQHPYTTKEEKMIIKKRHPRLNPYLPKRCKCYQHDEHVYIFVKRHGKSSSYFKTLKFKQNSFFLLNFATNLTTREIQKPL